MSLKPILPGGLYNEPPASSPGGSSGDLQWNNGGVFAGGGPTWDGTNLSATTFQAAGGDFVDIIKVPLSGGNGMRLFTNGGVLWLTNGSTSPLFTASTSLFNIGSGAVQLSGVGVTASISVSDSFFLLTIGSTVYEIPCKAH